MTARLPALARGVAGVLIGGIITALTFLIMVQGSFRQGIMDFDWGHVLGTSIHGSAEETTGGQALDVIGDTAGPDALYATLIAGVVLLAFHALVVVRFVRKPWPVQGLVLGVVAFLAIGFIYMPYVDANLDTPIGLWGSDQGSWTPVVLGLSALGACQLGARVYDLASRPSWWQSQEITIDETLESLTGVDTASLELPEKGAEKSSMRP